MKTLAYFDGGDTYKGCRERTPAEIGDLPRLRPRALIRPSYASDAAPAVAQGQRWQPDVASMNQLNMF